MGVYLSNHIGPVLIVQITFSTKPTFKLACPNSVCARKTFSNEAKFCPTCGSELTEVPGVPEKLELPTTQQIWDELLSAGLSEDALTSNCFIGDLPEDIRVYTPNHRRNPPRNFNAKSPRNLLLDITECDVEGEKKWFSEAFAAEIAAFKKLYKSVEIKWAFLNYEY